MTIAIALSLSLLPLPQAPPAAAARLTDSQVKDLLTRVDDERDRFEDQLEGNVKHKVLRGPNGEVDVAEVPRRFAGNVDKMKGRYKNDYSAGSEVATCSARAARSSASCRRRRPT